MSQRIRNDEAGAGVGGEAGDAVQEPTPTAGVLRGASSSSSLRTEDAATEENAAASLRILMTNRPPEKLEINRSPTAILRSSSSTKKDKEDAEDAQTQQEEDQDDSQLVVVASSSHVLKNDCDNSKMSCDDANHDDDEEEEEQPKEEEKDNTTTSRIVATVNTPNDREERTATPPPPFLSPHTKNKKNPPPAPITIQRSAIKKLVAVNPASSTRTRTTTASLPVSSSNEQPHSNRNQKEEEEQQQKKEEEQEEKEEEEEKDNTSILSMPMPPEMSEMQRSTILLSEQECMVDMDAKEDTSDSDANATAKTADATDSIPCLLRSPRNNPPAIATMQRSAIKSVGVPNQPSGMRTTTAAAAPAISFSSLNEHRQHNNHEHENQNNKNSDNSNTNHCRSNSSSYESFDELINNNSTNHGCCDNDKETAEGIVGTNTANGNAVQDPDNVQDDSSLLLREQQQPSILPAAANSVSSSSSSSNECNISNLMDSNNSNPHNQSNTNINTNTNNDTAVDDDEDHGRSSNNEESDDPLRAPLLPSSTHTSTDADADANAKDITLALRCYCGSTNNKTVSVNHNVLLNLVLSILYGISNSLWNGTAYLVYIKKLAHGSNKPVGMIEAVSGLASLLCALPIGYCADTYGRAIVIKVGSVVFVVTSLVQIGILEYAGTVDDEYDTNDDDNTTSTNFMFDFNDMFDTSVTSSGDDNTNIALWLMGGIMIFWGFGDGIIQGPCQALYADSTPQGNRSKYFTYQFVCYLIASSVGPLVSIVMFQTLGDNWDMYHLKLVIYVGLILEVFNSILMCFFDDSKALDEEAANENEDGRCDTTNVGQENNDATGENQEDMYDASCISENSNLADDVRADDEHDLLLVDANNNVNTNILTDVSNSITITFTVANDDGEERTTAVLQKRREWIPYIVFISGLISSLGSGMTVKFFPLFFKDEVGMTPSQVQIIYTLVPIVMAIFGTFATKLATDIGFGRVQTMIVFWIVGISLLLSMVVFKSYLDVHPIYLVPIYVLRTALMNSVYPLENSILMDYVPKNQRARWKSLDSVASFGWCGSAAFGGWLADKYDYTHTFLCTAVFQIVALCIWCLLLPLVPRLEGTSSNDHNSNDSDCRESSSNRDAIGSNNNNNVNLVDGGVTDSRCDATNYVGDVDERRNNNATRITVDGDT